MFGKPVIKGTRIPVEIILRKLSQNISIDKILQDYPHLTSKDIQAALEYAAESVHGEEVYLLRVVNEIIGKEQRINDKEKCRKLTQRNASGD
jgi:uncharacterized protein (DUF433 family)